MIKIYSATIGLRWVASQRQFSHCLEIHSGQFNLLLKSLINQLTQKLKTKYKPDNCDILKSTH